MRTAIKWGVILGVAVCLWTLMLHALGWYTTNLAAGQRADVVATILPVAAIVLALLERRRRLDRGLTIGESVLTGLVVGAVSIPITSGFLWWYHHAINPQWLEHLVVYQRAKMAAAGTSADEIGKAVAAQRAAGTDRAQLTGALAGTILISLVIATIAGLFMRRPPRQQRAP